MGTPFGGFLDSTTDRLGEAVMLGSIGLVFARDGNEIALAAVFAAMAGSFLVSYARPRRGAEAEGRRRHRQPRRAGVRDRQRPLPRSVGLLPWAVYLLNVTAWITVVQRIIHVRRQLKQY